MARTDVVIARQVVTGTGADSTRSSVAFGDADTGFAERIDDELGVIIAGTRRFAFSGSDFVKDDGTKYITSATVEDDSIKSQHILDGAIMNADISGAALIVLNKLASGTQGNVLIYDSASRVSGAATGAGTTGQVLTSNGAAANPSWQAAAAGEGRLPL